MADTINTGGLLINILALDPATKCGWAISPTIGGVWDLSTRRDESGGMKLIRLRTKLVEVTCAYSTSVIVFEAARNCAPSMQGALVHQAELQAIIKAFAEDNEIDYRGYSPTEIKRHATGKGNANKEAMMQAARERGWLFADDNHADALWLLDLASHEMDSKALGTKAR
jgi:Holliday junction resolvasome RuvABC endonuclease subunit